jgi:hypothetical protein
MGVKVCNMNCAYCQYGWARGERARLTRRPSWPSPGQVGAAVTARLLKAERTGETLDRITVAGHGEPTLHPAFEEITERLVDVRDRLAPDLRLVVLSNSTTAAWPGAASADPAGRTPHEARCRRSDYVCHVNGLGRRSAPSSILRGLPRGAAVMFVSDG